MAKSRVANPVRICQVDGCDTKHFAKGYCKKHYYQDKRHGKIFKRTIFDPNEFVIDGGVCYIKLYNKDCETIATTVIDADDVELVSGLKWTLNHGYVQNERTGKILARMIMHPVPTGLRVDHKDRNPLNNRRSNLRHATRSQNRANSFYATNKSGFKGVCWHKKAGKWRSTIQYENQWHHLGCFDSKEEAALAYNEKALELHGEFAMLNEV